MEKNERKPFDEFKVNNRQKTIIKGLMEQRFSIKNLADMYIGALKVLKNKTNPERFNQSALSLRELVKNLTSETEILNRSDEAHKELMKSFIINASFDCNNFVSAKCKYNFCFFVISKKCIGSMILLFYLLKYPQ